MKDLLIGKLGKCFGLKGEVRLILLTSFPELRFCKGRKLSISNGKEAVEATVKALRLTEKGYLISFEEMPSINEVEPYVGFSLFMDKTEAPLPEGNYRYGDLIGMEVFSESGESLGGQRRPRLRPEEDASRRTGKESGFLRPLRR